MSDRWFRYSSFVALSSRAVIVCAPCRRTERVRRKQLQQLVAVGRRLGREHAILRRDGVTSPPAWNALR